MKLIFWLCASAFALNTPHICAQGKIKLPKPVVEKPTPESYQNDGNKSRLSIFRSMKIKFDFSNLEKLGAKYSMNISVIKLVVIPEMEKLITASLKVSGKTTISPMSPTDCDSIITIGSPYTQKPTEADLIIFITGQYDIFSNYVAYAGACLLSSTDKRPVVGLISFNLAYMDFKTSSIDENVRVAYHEITHVLGFSTDLYDYFPNYINKTDTLYFRDRDGVFNIKSTNVMNFAKKHFNCYHLAGVPLEDEGGSGSASSHWEKLLFDNEIMTGQINPQMILSGLTLSLFKDMGWYEVDMSGAEVLTFGYNEGCSFAAKTCDPSKYAEQCSESTTETACTHDFKSVSKCRINIFSNYCGILRQFETGICDQPLSSDFMFPFGFETKGPTSRCFTGTTGYGSIIAGCFKSECTGGNKITVTIQNKKYSCTTDGQVLKISFNNEDYTVKCPNISKFCSWRTLNPCKNDCNGRGICRENANCSCRYPYSGNSCSTAPLRCPYSDQAVCDQLFPGLPMPMPTPGPGPVTYVWLTSIASVALLILILF